MISRHAKRLLKLRVDEIEVKARISNDNDGQGEVRQERERKERGVRTALSTLYYLPPIPTYLPTYGYRSSFPVACSFHRTAFVPLVDLLRFVVSCRTRHLCLHFLFFVGFGLFCFGFSFFFWFYVVFVSVWFLLHEHSPVPFFLVLFWFVSVTHSYPGYVCICDFVSVYLLIYYQVFINFVLVLFVRSPSPSLFLLSACPPGADHPSPPHGQLHVRTVAPHGRLPGVPGPHHGSDEAVVLSHAGRRHLHAQPLPRQQLRPGENAVQCNARQSS